MVLSAISSPVGLEAMYQYTYEYKRVPVVRAELLVCGCRNRNLSVALRLV